MSERKRGYMADHERGEQAEFEDARQRPLDDTGRAIWPAPSPPSLLRRASPAGLVYLQGTFLSIRLPICMIFQLF